MKKMVMSVKRKLLMGTAKRNTLPLKRTINSGIIGILAPFAQRNSGRFSN